MCADVTAAQIPVNFPMLLYVTLTLLLCLFLILGDTMKTAAHTRVAYTLNFFFLNLHYYEILQIYHKLLGEQMIIKLKIFFFKITGGAAGPQHKIVKIFKKLTLKFSTFDFKGLLTRSMKNFVRRVILVSLTKLLSVKNFLRIEKKFFSVHQRNKKMFGVQNFYATCKQGLK